MNTCGAKHTKYQPADDEWKCPRCGIPVQTEGGNDGFIIADPAYNSSCECELLHEHDILACAVCEYDISGRAFANRIHKAKNLVTCPCCNGKGLVDGSKVNSNKKGK